MGKVKGRYISSVLFVEEIKASRDFYENTLGQTVGLDHGECVAFSAGFSIWLRDYAYRIIFKEQYTGQFSEERGVELYFEADDIKETRDLLWEQGIRFVHDIIEQPWGQRVFRIYDPDKYIVEFGEPMYRVVKRFIEQGMSAEETAERTSMPLDVVKEMAK